jgi:hypothetical protein
MHLLISSSMIKPSIFENTMGFSVQEVFGAGCQGNLDFFQKPLYSVHNSHNSIEL